ncbi:hypothetical protein WR25_01463 [Diploscapter pachys]|uniref:Apple domain-containing protein n=1 Tax=Diploscapter pachys TaxID=2018661 RepID=A0A2A2LGQ8_9BILA|nr:hypothetical protein WR25_01463 [Diploscapter pachys]
MHRPADVLLHVLLLCGILLNGSSQPQQNSCIKDLADDVCPQREGFDMECQAKCEKIYSIASRSLCQLRDSNGDYLVSTPHSSVPSSAILLSTCSLCSTSSVNVSARVWRSEGVNVQLCFREDQETICAPIKTSNGHLLNEGLPGSRHFQIVFKFSNVSAGSAILVDDLSVSFSSCRQEDNRHEVGVVGQSKQRFRHQCVGDDCPPKRVRMCEGREGLQACRRKCSDQQDNGSGARCIRRNIQQKICVCQLRRKMPSAPMVYKNEYEDVTTTTMQTKKDKECLLQCSNGKCSCVPTICTNSLCDFERGRECGWADMRLLSSSFNNVTVAEKKENRYGLIRLPPFGYAGLVRRSRVDGPIRMSIDLFPSAAVQVRICVHSLHRCQSHRVSERAWNRLTARIRVQTAHRIFIIFYNPSAQGKILAMDNISTSGGTCYFL